MLFAQTKGFNHVIQSFKFQTCSPEPSKYAGESLLKVLKVRRKYFLALGAVASPYHKDGDFISGGLPYLRP